MNSGSALLPAARLRLRAAVFLSGACVMVLQVLGTRIIGPHYGVGLYVWTSLIAVTLVALALGYWIGGKLADLRPSLTWFACVLLVAAATVGLIPLLRGWILEAGWFFGLRGGALISALVLFFPPLFFLGMVSPYAVRLEACGAETAGRSAGRLYAISTTGSVAGALLAGFYLVPNFRVPVVLGIIAVSLACAASLAAAPGLRKGIIVPAISLAALAGFAALPRPIPPALLAARSFGNSDLRVVEHDGNRFLLVDQAAQSSLAANGHPREQYTYFFASRVLLARPEARNAAIIGLGGGSLVTLLAEKGLDLEVAEISPEIIAVARDHFGLQLPPDKVHLADGRVFLRENPGRFDIVLLDAFSGDRIAFSLLSREGLLSAKTSLTRGGLLALNTWGIDPAKGAPNAVGAAVRATLEKVFAHVLAVPAAGNLLFFASDEPIVPRREVVNFETFDGPREFRWLDVPPTQWPQGVVLTDDWNPVDTLGLAGVESLRTTRRENVPPDVSAALDWE